MSEQALQRLQAASSIPGYHPYTEGMTEEENEARIEHNERAWASNEVNNLLDTIDSLRDQILYVESKIEYLTGAYGLDDEEES